MIETSGGPNHDWSSHGADGFGLMCIHYDQPDGTTPPPERYRGRRTTSGGGSWQSALQLEQTHQQKTVRPKTEPPMMHWSYRSGSIALAYPTNGTVASNYGLLSRRTCCF
jgi:hypothetical protein